MWYDLYAHNVIYLGKCLSLLVGKHFSAIKAFIGFQQRGVKHDLWYHSSFIFPRNAFVINEIIISRWALRAVVPNHYSGDHKCSLSSLEVLPQNTKVAILIILCKKMKAASKYYVFSKNTTVRCSATFSLKVAIPLGWIIRLLLFVTHMK